MLIIVIIASRAAEAALLDEKLNFMIGNFLSICSCRALPRHTIYLSPKAEDCPIEDGNPQGTGVVLLLPGLLSSMAFACDSFRLFPANR